MQPLQHLENTNLEVWRTPGGRLVFVHTLKRCKGIPGKIPCVVHDPVAGSWDDLELIFRGDRGIFERICVHGVGHPDPNQIDFWKLAGQEFLGDHGCDGCCNEWPDQMEAANQRRTRPAP
jgi:hypothetical protein